MVRDSGSNLHFSQTLRGEALADFYERIMVPPVNKPSKCPDVSRFSDAGDDEAGDRLEDRRLKSAEAVRPCSLSGLLTASACVVIEPSLNRVCRLVPGAGEADGAAEKSIAATSANW